MAFNEALHPRAGSGKFVPAPHDEPAVVNDDWREYATAECLRVAETVGEEIISGWERDGGTELGSRTAQQALEPVQLTGEAKATFRALFPRLPNDEVEAGAGLVVGAYLLSRWFRENPTYAGGEADGAGGADGRRLRLDLFDRDQPINGVRPQEGDAWFRELGEENGWLWDFEASRRAAALVDRDTAFGRPNNALRAG